MKFSKTIIYFIPVILMSTSCKTERLVNRDVPAAVSTLETTELDDPIHVLLFSATGWYRHPEIPLINGWLVRQAAQRNIQMDVSETGSDITAETLTKYDVLFLNNANVLDKVMTAESRAAVEEWFKQGGGLFALHATLVHQEEWPWLMNLGGCDFNSDSEFLKARIMVDPAAIDHPSVKGWGQEFLYTADWTNHTKSVTGTPGLQVLLRIDENSYEPVREYFKTRGGKAMGDDHPIAWLREWDGGRFFYTELGHDVRSIDTDFGKQHIFEGIKWAAGIDGKSKD